ncbi:hypothetical protein U1Q18_049814, partial [Sarracenia purpurea var. burkii]
FGRCDDSVVVGSGVMIEEFVEFCAGGVSRPGNWNSIDGNVDGSFSGGAEHISE